MPHLANPLGNEEIDFAKEQLSIWSNGKISHVKESKYSVQYSQFHFFLARFIFWMQSKVCALFIRNIIHTTDTYVTFL